MDDIKKYIESGILELYALGDVSPEERKLVEQLVAAHPELKEELREIENALEFYALENAVAPSPDYRSKMLNSVAANSQQNSSIHSTQQPEVEKTISISRPQMVNFYKYAFAASLVLLMGSLAVLYAIYGKLQQSRQQLLVLNSQNVKFSQTINHMTDELDVFRDTTFRLLKLKGTEKMPAAHMTVAWSPVKQKVMIDMVDMLLPENDSNHQYQLWAMVNGKPVDLGVFDSAQKDSVDMKLMKPVALAAAFAVTLEPRGGSINPTMSEMMAIGQF